MTAPVSDLPSDQPLQRSRDFGGLLSTQFLGAFNDNYFKQMVLLKCTELAAGGESNLQSLALAAFAAPFVLLSGFGGYLSDRYSKWTIVFWCKVAEILVMAASLLVLLSGAEGVSQARLFIVVLAFMGAQSAFFGPAKYGILPELFSPRRLLPVNGGVQMTTFLAIILGTAAAGIALAKLDNSLWMCSILAIGIAAIGTLTSMLIRKTRVAQPDIVLKVDNLAVPADIRVFLRQHPQMFVALLVMTAFWFIGGVAQPAVNNLGDLTLNVGKTRTSLLATNIAIGIAVGCVIAGVANKDSASGARWTRIGSWLIVLSLVLVSVVGSGMLGTPVAIEGVEPDLLPALLAPDAAEWLLRGTLFLLGVAAGIFVIPVQVYIQKFPPAELKGRMIGTMNFMTWIGILMSALFLEIIQRLLILCFGEKQSDQHHYLTFLAIAFIMLPIALFYRLPPAQQEASAE